MFNEPQAGHRAPGAGTAYRWGAAGGRQRLLLALVLLSLLGCGDAPGGRRGQEDARTEPGAAAPVSAVDDSGREVSLPRPARRVVSLLPAGTETLFALGATDQVVGRTRYDTDPEVAHLPSVGGGLDPSLEALAALRPDLVIAFETVGGSRVRPRIEALGVPVFAIATRDTADIFRNIRNLGHLAGRDSTARALAARIRAGLDSVRASVRPGPRPRVLYVVSIDPPMPAGTGNFLSELIGLAGGEPLAVAAEHPGASPQVSLEELVRLQPDLVILPVGDDSTAALRRLRGEPGWRDLRAVREGRVAPVPADLANRPGPRIAEVARVLRDAIRRHAPR